MNKNFSLGERVKDLRTQKGFSQEQLALRANITTAYLGQVERNVKNPTVMVVEKICSALEISLSDFFNTTEDLSGELDTLSQQILNQVNNRTDEEKQIILHITKQALKLRDLQ